MCRNKNMLKCVVLNTKEYISFTASPSDLPLPVGEVQEGEDRGAAGSWAEFSVRAVVWQVAVAGRLGRRGTGGGAVSIWIWWEKQSVEKRWC